VERRIAQVAGNEQWLQHAAAAAHNRLEEVVGGWMDLYLGPLLTEY